MSDCLDPAETTPASRWGASSDRNRSLRELWPAGYALLLCVAFAPDLIFPTFTPRMALLLLAAPAGAVALVGLARRGDRAAIISICLVVWIVVSGSVSGAPLIALRGTVGNEMSGLIVAGVLCLWALGRSLDANQKRLLVGGVFVGLCASGAIGLLQIVLDIRSGSLALWVDQPTGLTPNPVFFGSLMAGGAVMAASMVTTTWNRCQALPLGLLVAFGFMANASGSRVSVVGGLLGVCAVALRRSYDRKLLVLPAIYLISVVTSSLFVSRVASTRSASDRVFNDSSNAGRWSAWNYGWKAFLERPLTGWGFGRFRAATQLHYSAEFGGQSAGNDLGSAWFDAHNIVVTAVVAVGIVGAALVLWFAVEVVRHSSGPTMWFVVGVGSTWFLQPAGLATAPLVAFMLGAGMRSREVDRRDEQAETSAASRQPVGSAGVVGAALVIGALLSLGLLAADIRLSRAVNRLEPEDMEHAASWFPKDPVVADLVAQAWLISDSEFETTRSKVLDWSEKAIEAEPDRAYYHSQLAYRLLVFAEPEAAREALDDALEQQPWHVTSWSLMATYAAIVDDPATEAVANSKLCAMLRTDLCD